MEHMVRKEPWHQGWIAGFQVRVGPRGFGSGSIACEIGSSSPHWTSVSHLFKGDDTCPRYPPKVGFFKNNFLVALMSTRNLEVSVQAGILLTISFSTPALSWIYSHCFHLH